jgi:16S rRNA (guanine527-N7)-methyltransferase
METASPVLPQETDLWQQTLDWHPDPQQQAKFQQLYQLTLEGNRQLNLTRITDPQEFWEKHLWDSLRGIKPWLGNQPPSSLSVIDIGTGAGFPGLPVAIAHPTWHVTLLDSTRKKITFVARLIEALGLQTVMAISDRAEQLGRDPLHRRKYDLVLIRAVAAAPVCVEYALPFLKYGGIAVLYRGQWTEAEAIALEAALEQLGGQLETVDAFKTPLSGSDRHCLQIRKVAATPAEFPRAAGTPAHHPLA